jgi:hypothetical protein
LTENDNKYLQVPKTSGNDADSSMLELQQELAKKRRDYAPLLKKLFTDQRVLLILFTFKEYRA